MGVTGNTSSVNSFSDNLTTQGESSPDRGEETSQSIQPSLEPTILITGVCVCVYGCVCLCQMEKQSQSTVVSQRMRLLYAHPLNDQLVTTTTDTECVKTTTNLSYSQGG